MKIKPWLALCVNFGLVGCLASQPNLEAQAPNDDAQCVSLGYQHGTSGYLQCRQMLASNHIAEAQARGAAISDFGQRLQAADAAAQAASPPPPPPPAMAQTTSCKPAWGGGMTCQTY
jgi:hypothetical protein